MTIIDSDGYNGSDGDCEGYGTDFSRDNNDMTVMTHADSINR